MEQGGISVLSYLATVDMLVLHPRGHVALAGDVNALRESLDYRGAVLLVGLVQDGDDLLELIGRGLW